jgi:hypothetical protein
VLTAGGGGRMRVRGVVSRVVAVGAVALCAASVQAQGKLGPVLVTSDAAATISVDGSETVMIAAGAAKQITLSSGEHLVAAVTADGRRLTRVVKPRVEQIVVDFDFSTVAPSAGAEKAAGAAAASVAPAAASAPAAGTASDSAPARIPAGAKLYLASMNGFETYLAAAIRKKEVPVTLVTSKAMADFEVTGSAESKKPGLFKTLMTGASGSDEGMSVAVTHIKSGAIVYAYQYQKGNTWHGKQSSSEAAAKHLKNHIEGKE